jgi:hypothetical protein
MLERAAVCRKRTNEIRKVFARKVGLFRMGQNKLGP